MSRFTPHGCDVFDRLKCIAFVDMPFHPVRVIVNGDILVGGLTDSYILATELSEDFGEKR